MQRWRVTAEHSDGRKDVRFVHAKTATNALAVAQLHRGWGADLSVEAIVFSNEWDAALRKADDLVVEMIRSGDPKLTDAARDSKGRVDYTELVKVALVEREKIARKIMEGEILWQTR